MGTWFNKRRDAVKKLLDAINEEEHTLADDERLEYLLKQHLVITLDYIANAISDRKLRLNKYGIIRIFEEMPTETFTYLRENRDVKDVISKNSITTMDEEILEMLGESYAKLGIPVEKVPEIGISDNNFLYGYLMNFPEKENDIIREGSPMYGQYIKYVNLVERAQSELDLGHAKDEQNFLKGRTQKIAEAEALVDKQQGQQQE